MQDYGIYIGNGIERPLPDRHITKKETKSKVEKSKNSRELIEEYFELSAKIKEYEIVLDKLKAKKTKLGKEIINRPELKDLVEELKSNNTHSRTK